MPKRESYYNLAKREIPAKWYESSDIKWPPRIVSLVYALIWFTTLVKFEDKLETTIIHTGIAMALLTSTRLLDIETTLNTMDTLRNVPDEVAISLFEGNTKYPEKPRKHEVYTWYFLLHTIISFVGKSIIPFWAVHDAMVYYLAGLNNVRKNKRVLLAKDLYESEN